MRERWAKASVWTAAAWLVLVSLIKLLDGSPASLPPIVRDGWFGPEWNYRLSISVELGVGALALIWPRLGFVALSALYSVFLAVLIHLAFSGAESCGCFGGAVTFPPLAMIAIDGTLLAFMLFTRPLRTLRGPAPRTWLLVTALAIAVVAPQLILRIDDERPRFVVLDPASWVGRSIHDTELAPWIDTHALPGDATWILYRVDCDHCAEHLASLERSFADDPKLYVLVELGEVGAEERRTVHVMPPGEHARLPEDIQWVSGTPWELVLEGDSVLSARDAHTLR